MWPNAALNLRAPFRPCAGVCASQQSPGRKNNKSVSPSAANPRCRSNRRRGTARRKSVCAFWSWAAPASSGCNSARRFLQSCLNWKSFLLTARVSACTPAGDEDTRGAERQSTVAAQPWNFCQLPAAAHSLQPRGRHVFPTSCSNLARLIARPTPCTRNERARDAQCKAPMYDGTPSTDHEQRACRATTRLSARSDVQSRGSAPRPARLRLRAASRSGRSGVQSSSAENAEEGVQVACSRERAASPAYTRTRTSSLAQRGSAPTSLAASCLFGAPL